LNLLKKLEESPKEMEIILGSFMYTILQKIQKYFFKESLACLALEKLEKQLTYKKEKELHMQVNT
jgi:hypothetical protein